MKLGRVSHVVYLQYRSQILLQRALQKSNYTEVHRVLENPIIFSCGVSNLEKNHAIDRDSRHSLRGYIAYANPDQKPTFMQVPEIHEYHNDASFLSISTYIRQISLAMPFHLIEVTTDEQFGKMMPGLWEAIHSPRNTLFELSFPVKSEGAEGVALAMEDCRVRLMGGWHANPGGHYIQILDDDNDAVVASAYWTFYNNENNPFLNPDKPEPKSRATWWPEGSEIKKYTLLIEDQGHAPMLERQKRPHLFLGVLYTTPVYRRQGAASMLVDWGVKKADEQNVECFVYSTAMAVQTYKNSGFIVVDETYFDTTVENPSEEWKELERNYPWGPQINMWRPIGGKHEQGEKYPWER